MQSNLQLYDKYYDFIYHGKDYKKETGLIFNLSKKFGIKSPKKILEIGCGTGNHTMLLAKTGISLVAIDIDLEMVKIARKKLSDRQNVKIIHTSIEHLKEKRFDLVIAMFNVVTYIESCKQLIQFMKGVAKRLNRNGVFIFDCWNGVAAIKDPPKRLKKTTVKQDGMTLEYNLTSQTDFFNQKTRLNYEIKVKSGRIIEQGNSSFDQTLWTPMQVRFAIEEAGMKVIFCSPIMQPDKEATETDWKIMFCCKKSG